MLSITSDQLATFDRQAELRFVSNACRFLRDHAGADLTGYDDARLAAFVQESMALARARQVRTEAGMVKWALLRIIAGPAFHELPEVRKCFETASSGDLILNRIFDRIAILERRRQV